MNDKVSVEVENISDTQRSLKITVPEGDVQDAMKVATEAVKKKAKLKGFRKGKAPDHMIQKAYGHEIQNEAVYHLLDATYIKALDQCDLEIVGHPSIKDVDFQEGRPFTYTAQVEIMPDVELKKHKGLKIKVFEGEVDDKRVQEELDKLQDAHSQLVPIGAPRALAMGDFAILDLQSTSGGEPFVEGTGQGITIEMGKTDWIPGFEGALLSMMPEEEREFDLTFPADHEQFPGKEIHMQAKLNEIKRKELVELNDEFAKDLGDFGSLEELKKRILENVTWENEDQAKQFANRQLIEGLVDENPLEVPKAMVDHEIKQYLEDFKKRMRQQKHLDPDEDMLQSFGEHYRPQAERRVKAGLLLRAVVKKEGIEVKDEDVEQYLQKISERMHQPLEEVRKMYGADKALESLKLTLEEEKTLEILRENAKIIKKIRDVKELSQEMAKDAPEHSNHP